MVQHTCTSMFLQVCCLNSKDMFLLLFLMMSSKLELSALPKYCQALGTRKLSIRINHKHFVYTISLPDSMTVMTV